MKDWWLSLNTRNQQMLSLLVLFCVGFLIYEIIFAPLIQSNQTLRTDITHSQSLLTWMQTTAKRIDNLQQAQPKSNAQKSGLLSILQKQINTAGFSTHLTKLNQADNNAVEIELQNISFDQVIHWLTNLKRQQNIDVIRFNATPTGTIGNVNATILLI